MPLTEKVRGGRFCEKCGSEIKWIHLLSGSWIAVEPMPVMYIPHSGRKWLVEGKNRDAVILKDCEIWKPGMLHDRLKKGYLPHKWQCDAEDHRTQRWTGKRRAEHGNAESAGD